MKHSSIIFLIVCLALVALVSGCNEEKTTLAEKRLVVEGWIDSGEFPVVKLTRTMPLGVDHKVDIDKLSDYMERWAKVTISDGERSEVMVGRYDKNYFPPFVYTSYEMRGEVGKTYTITVETDNGERATDHHPRADTTEGCMQRTGRRRRRLSDLRIYGREEEVQAVCEELL